MARCKACGYITPEHKVKDYCPACGEPAGIFEPFDEKIKPLRKKLLGLFLHPISVHFPQAFATVIPALVVLAYLVPENFKGEFQNAARVLALLLPFSVMGAFSMGLLDGQVRFKSLTTRALKKKIFFASLFTGFSVMTAWLAYSRGLSGPNDLIIALLCLACVGCAMVLGKIGDKLICARLPN